MKKEGTEKPRAKRYLQAFDVLVRAKVISGSSAWSKLLNTMERRVRFEDGYVVGWFDCLRRKPAPRRKVKR